MDVQQLVNVFVECGLPMGLILVTWSNRGRRDYYLVLPGGLTVREIPKGGSVWLRWLPFLFFTYISLAIISLLQGLFSLSTQGSSHPLPLLYLTTAAPVPQLLLVKQIKKRV